MAVSRKFLTDGEDVVLSMRTHIKALAVPALILVLVCAATGFLIAVIPSGSAHKWLVIVVLVIAVIILLWWVIAPFLRWMSTTYTVTTRRIVEQKGVFSRSGRVIPLQRVNDVAYEKGIFDRMLGCGTLSIRDASETGGMVLHDVPQVESVHHTISDLLFSLHDGSDDDGTRLQHGHGDGDPSGR
ncbi:MAG: PH domain-containing protein [Nocardioidaceae bacterium]